MQQVLRFQRQLAAHNDRDWFNEHRSAYDQSNREFKRFVKGLENAIMEHDHIDPGQTKIFRIYRDVRFSDDKTPYHRHRSVSFTRATESLRGGYYLRVEPGDNSFLAGGFWRPNPADLLHIRKQLQQNPEELRDILESPNIRSYFGDLEGEKVKTSPRGFNQDDPAIDLLRFKGFILSRRFTDDEVGKDDFLENVNHGFVRLRPFFDYMTDILTTDLNGQSLINT